MSDKSFGDHLNRNIVKNPLLSTAVTGLSIEDLTHNAVLLPVVPTQELITRQEPQSGPQSATLAQPDRNDNFRSGDANSNILHTNYPPANKTNHHDNQLNIKNVQNQQSTQSKASAKSDDDFDVNEYFARLQGTRYVSAPLNSILKEDQKATLDPTDENLEEINLNEPDKSQHVEIQQSLTADIAQNFSQLPTVLPQVASAVFSSFSNMLSMKSREQTPDEPSPKPSGYQEVQFQRPDDYNVPLMSMNEPVAQKEVAPPPTQPPIGGTTNYRITTKKKTYAQIPGLSSTHQVANPMPSTTAPYYNSDFSSPVVPPPINIVGMERNEPIKSDEMPTQAQTLNIFNPVPVDFNTQTNLGPITTECNVYNMLDVDKKLSQQPSVIEPNFSVQGKDSNIFKTVENRDQIVSQNITNTSIIPPPPMFSNAPKKDIQSNAKSVLPPSVARRIGSNHPIIKPQTLITSVPTDNIFIPEAVPDISTEAGFGSSSIPYPLDSTLPVKDDKLPMGSQSAFVQFNSPTMNIDKSFPPTLQESTKADLPPEISGTGINSSISGPPGATLQFIPQPDSRTPSNISPITHETEISSNLFSATPGSRTDVAPPPLFFNPSAIQSTDFKSPQVVNPPSIPADKHPPINLPPMLPVSTFCKPPQVSDKPQSGISNIAIQNYDQSASMAEAFKPLPEPPKLSGNLSYRMTKKRPQYYSGPIEGVGAISNNVKPTMPSIESNTFHGALFVPDTQSTAEKQTHVNSPTAFDINQHTVVPPAISTYSQHDINSPETKNYVSNEFNTAFDMSRQTTDNYEPPKQEARSFGIIGSLKSKLSSIDINKIQNSVTTFFDPAYNNTKKEPSKIDMGFNEFNYQDGSLEVFVPYVEDSNQIYEQFGCQTTYNYTQSNQYYQNQTYDYGPGSENYNSQSLFSNFNQNPPIQNYDTSNIQASYYSSDNKVKSQTEAFNEASADTHLPSSGIATSKIQNPLSHVIEPSYTIDKKDEGNKSQLLEVTEQLQKTASISNESVSPYVDYVIPQPIKANTTQPIQMLTQENVGLHNDDKNNVYSKPAEFHDTSAGSFFDNKEFFSFSQPNFTEELNEKLENLQISQEKQEKSFQHSKIVAKNTHSDVFAKASDLCSPIELEIEKRFGNNFFGDLTPLHSKIPDDLQSPISNFGSTGIEEIDRFGNNDSIIGNCSLDSISNDGTMDDIPRLDAPTILFGLPSLPVTNPIAELDSDTNNKSSYETSQKSDNQNDANFFDNIIGENKPLSEKCESTSELNICETCREFNKPEEREVDNVTSQLIENITSPIQLLNPVIALLTESNTPIEDTSDYDSKQCAEISHITEETIETIQVQSATELLDDEEVNTSNIRNYGWTPEESTYIPTEVPLDHNYSFQIDPNAIGFYGSNSFFFEDIPNNASDEIKAEFKNTHEESPVVLPRQMSVPSAPPAEDEDDNNSDETGVLDVLSIEQDAKKDFPIYEEFVIEPSETDDDKIEYKVRERSSEDPIPEIDTFTNRVKKFKQMEEFVDKSDEVFGSQNNVLYDLNDTTSPALPIASYFDTGNYAADIHYKNSASSPSMPFQVTSPNMPFSIPPGFENEYIKRLSAMAIQDDKKSDKDDNAPYIPDTSTQTRPVITTTYSSLSNISPNLTVTSNMKNTSIPQEARTTEIRELPEFSTVFSQKPESGDNLASTLFTKIDDKPLAIIHEPKLEKEPVKPQTLPDPISFFSAKEETPTVESSDIGFNRLASYFATPSKQDHSKPFFELSQSQNHYRHDNPNSKFDSGVKNTNQDTCQKQNNTSQASSPQNIPTDVYVANLRLMNELTSSQNIAFNPNDQIVRTINYFTIEYDNGAEIKNSVYETNLKILDKHIDSALEVDEKGECDDANYVTVVKKCKFCCNNDNRCVVAFNKVQVDTNFKVRKGVDVDGNGNNSENKTDRKPDMDSRQQDGRREVTLSFGSPLDEDSERISIVTENRASAEYSPVKHHWFYRVDVEEKSIWRGFSITDNKALEEAFLSPDLNENTAVATDGGRFDVNIIGRIRTPVYWSDKPTNVRRCSWFYKGTTDARYVPYTEPVAEKLEEEYRHGVTTGEWHRRLVLPSRELVVLHGPAVMVHLAHPPDGLSPQPQSTMRPRVVRRGCDETEIEDSEPSSIDHLLLLCHGVGSACDMKFRSVEEVVDDFRATSLQLVQSHYRNSYDKGVVNRVEVLPISWHATLHSGETGVDRRLSAITLDSIPRLRNFTNDTVLDVLFYTSPVFCQTIIDTVCAELNRIYRMFMARNPGFSGQVSLGGHSLGSVILYDLLCHQRTEDSPSHSCPGKSYVQGAAGTGQASVHYPPLDFKPAALYALGSPIAMFECIRGVKSLGPDFCLPTCKNFFNIFHPYDPIAYRIEPLINSQLGSFKPYLIPHHKGRKRMHLELKDTMARVGADLKQKLIESLKSTWTSMWKTQPPPNDGQLEKVVEEEMEKEQLCDEVKEELSQSNELETPEVLGVLNAGRRVDYVLQEAPFEMINEYLFAMGSHVCYWESEDTMLLILKEIYDSLGVRPDCTVPQQSMTVQRNRNTNETISVATSDFPSTSRDTT